MSRELIKNNIIDGGITNQTPIEIMLEIDSEGNTTARKLYEYLQLDKSNFAKWVKRNILSNPFAIENSDFIRLVLENETPTGGKVLRDDYKITASFAKKLCMTSNTERGEQARNYFIKVEDMLKSKMSTKALTVPQDYEQALEALLIQVRENKQLKELNEENKPKVELYEKLMDGKNALDMNEVAHALGIGRNTLFSKLRSLGILMSNNVPYQRYMSQDYFKVVFVPVYIGEKSENKPKTLVKVKGLEFIHKKLKESNVTLLN